MKDKTIIRLCIWGAIILLMIFFGSEWILIWGMVYGFKGESDFFVTCLAWWYLQGIQLCAYFIFQLLCWIKKTLGEEKNEKDETCD